MCVHVVVDYKSRRALHVSSVAKVDAALVGAFVAAILKTDDTLARLQLLLREVAHVLVGLLRSDTRLAVVTRLELKYGSLAR